jgi:hypothetical protein
MKQSKKEKKLEKEKLNEQALFVHFKRKGDSKFVAKKKAKRLSKKTKKDIH